MRFDIFVVTMKRGQPSHTHLRESGIKPGKVERVFMDVVNEEYERLERGLAEPFGEIEGDGSIHNLSIVMTLTTNEIQEIVWIHGKERS